MFDGKEYLIIDDVVKKNFQDLLEEIITKQNSWAFRVNVCSVRREDVRHDSTMGFSLPLYNNFTNVKEDVYTDVVVPLIEEIAKKANIQYNEVLQARGFCLLPLDKKFIKQYDCVHIDLDEPHSVFLYYVNDADGDTVLFDKTTEEVPFKGLDIDPAKLGFKELARVKPKKGRVLIFNGNRYHTSTSPTVGARFIINVNVNNK